MDAEKLGESRFLNFLFRPAGASMESRLRHWVMPPKKTAALVWTAARQTSETLEYR